MIPGNNHLFDRFNSYWTPEPYSGCWLWTGTDNGLGYGKISVGGRNRKAHRVSWEINNGSIPSGMCVLHRCDIPCCVNPDHLFIGTVAENNRDRANKGRSNRPIGLLNGRCKLTEGQIKDIKSSQFGCNRLSRKHGVSATHIKRIRNGREWGHVQ